MRSITRTPSGEISARATSIPRNGAIESWMTSSRFMRNVPLTLVGPLPFKSTANDIFAVTASHAGERLISSSIYSVSDKLPIDTPFFMFRVDEHEEINTISKALNK